MSTTQILTELPRLSHAERREIARRLIELEEDAQVLTNCDCRDDANFRLLDALEAEDDARQSKACSRKN
jgi:hypothetical protein